MTSSSSDNDTPLRATVLYFSYNTIFDADYDFSSDETDTSLVIIPRTSHQITITRVRAFLFVVILTVGIVIPRDSQLTNSTAPRKSNREREPKLCSRTYHIASSIPIERLKTFSFSLN